MANIYGCMCTAFLPLLSLVITYLSITFLSLFFFIAAIQYDAAKIRKLKTLLVSEGYQNVIINFIRIYRNVLEIVYWIKLSSAGGYWDKKNLNASFFTMHNNNVMFANKM